MRSALLPTAYSHATFLPRLRVRPPSASRRMMPSRSRVVSALLAAKMDPSQPRRLREVTQPLANPRSMVPCRIDGPRGAEVPQGGLGIAIPIETYVGCSGSHPSAISIGLRAMLV